MANKLPQLRESVGKIPSRSSRQSVVDLSSCDWFTHHHCHGIYFLVPSHYHYHFFGHSFFFSVSTVLLFFHSSGFVNKIQTTFILQELAEPQLYHFISKQDAGYHKLDKIHHQTMAADCL